MINELVAIVWFRQDLRLNDNPAFVKACSNYKHVIPLYIKDNENGVVLGEAQRWWLYHSLNALNKSLKKQGLTLVLQTGDPLKIILNLVKQFSVEAVYWNCCYVAQAIAQDEIIKATLKERVGLKVYDSNGSLLNEPSVIKNNNGSFFKVFGPYWKHCRQTLQILSPLKKTNSPQGIEIQSEQLDEWHLLPKLNWDQGFYDIWTPGEEGAQKKLNDFINNQWLQT